MPFDGPTSADYDNVRSLNAAFLKLLQDRSRGERYVRDLPTGLARRLQQLDRKEIGWLSETPFLLLSFRERDDAFWQKTLGDGRNRDLFAQPALPFGNEAGRIIAAGLSFVWQLAHRNPYAARLVCEASTHWCEQITEQTICHLLGMTGSWPDLLVLRAHSEPDLWRKLLDAGLSYEFQTRQSAHISGLHYILTRRSGNAVLSAAACARRTPAFKVAEAPSDDS